MKPVEFRCKKTVSKNGTESKCNKFLCSVSDRINLVCRKCGGKYALVQLENGYWEMTALAAGPIRLNKSNEDNHGRKSNSGQRQSLHAHQG